MIRAELVIKHLYPDIKLNENPLIWTLPTGERIFNSNQQEAKTYIERYLDLEYKKPSIIGPFFDFDTSMYITSKGKIIAAFTLIDTNFMFPDLFSMYNFICIWEEERQAVKLLNEAKVNTPEFSGLLRYCRNLKFDLICCMQKYKN